MATTRMHHLLSACIDLSSRAGTIIRTVHSKGPTIHLKGNQSGIVAPISEYKPSDVQTEADRKAESLIVSSLRKAFPHITVVAEEETDGYQPDLSAAIDPELRLLDDYLKNENITALFEVPPKSDVVVWIDPLDGSLEFVKGNTFAVTCLLGISVDGEPVAGVIHQPFFEPAPRTIWGMVGVGVFGMRHPALSNEVRRRRGSQYNGKRCVTVGTSSNSNPRVTSALFSMSEYFDCAELKIGAAGYHGLCILEGKTDLWLSLSGNSKKWDICATDALQRALQRGKLTDANGYPYKYGSQADHRNLRGVVAAASAELHSHVLPYVSATFPDL